MKKFSIILLAAMLCVSLCSCGTVSYIMNNHLEEEQPPNNRFDEVSTPELQEDSSSDDISDESSDTPNMDVSIEEDEALEEVVEVPDAINKLLVGVYSAFSENPVDVSKWSDRAVCNAIYTKLNWDYIEDNYLEKKGIVAEQYNDGFESYDFEKVNKLTQDVFGRDFPIVASDYSFYVSGDKVLLSPATGEFATSKVKHLVKKGDMYYAIATHEGVHFFSSYYNGLFKATIKRNPDSYYGYSLVSVESINENETFYGMNASASSELAERTITHVAQHAIDGDVSTAWVEGVDGLGVGEWIMLSTSDGSKKNVLAIDFMLGYQKNVDLLEKNGWPCKVLIECANGYSEVFVLEAYECSAVLRESVLTDYVKITILEAEKGMKYDDVCISEIILHGCDFTEVVNGI